MRRNVARGASIRARTKRIATHRAELLMWFQSLEKEVVDLDKAYQTLLNMELERMLHQAEGGDLDGKT
jgi:hypothetical protein